MRHRVYRELYASAREDAELSLSHRWIVALTTLGHGDVAQIPPQETP